MNVASKKRMQIPVASRTDLFNKALDEYKKYERHTGTEPEWTGTEPFSYPTLTFAVREMRHLVQLKRATLLAKSGLIGRKTLERLKIFGLKVSKKKSTIDDLTCVTNRTQIKT